MNQEDKNQQIKHVKMFAWLWLAVGAFGLVWLVSRVLNIDNTDPALKKALLPGLMFIIGLIGTIQNKKVFDRLDKDNE